MPDRIAVAVDALDVRPDARLLEIGCGNGVAAGLVADRLESGSITAIDRSATAISRARDRLAQHVASGRVVLSQASLEAFDLPPAGYDTVFAINVNVFWTGLEADVAQRLKASLRPSGVLALFYEPPTPDGVGRIKRDVSGALGSTGFEVMNVLHDQGRSPLLEVNARPRGSVPRTSPEL